MNSCKKQTASARVNVLSKLRLLSLRLNLITFWKVCLQKCKHFNCLDSLMLEMWENAAVSFVFVCRSPLISLFFWVQSLDWDLFRQCDSLKHLKWSLKAGVLCLENWKLLPWTFLNTAERCALLRQASHLIRKNKLGNIFILCSTSAKYAVSLKYTCTDRCINTSMSTENRSQFTFKSIHTFHNQLFEWLGSAPACFKWPVL